MTDDDWKNILDDSESEIFEMAVTARETETDWLTILMKMECRIDHLITTQRTILSLLNNLQQVLNGIRINDAKQKVPEAARRFFDVRVEELELSVRADNCLKNANVRTVADLVQTTEAELLRMPNFGRVSLREIKEVLATLGLRLGMTLEELGIATTIDLVAAPSDDRVIAHVGHIDPTDSMSPSQQIQQWLSERGPLVRGDDK
jgi:DNA-directed RNA polymerase alpha subunit